MIILNVDKLLVEHKMRSIELANSIGCTPQTMSRLKTGKMRSLRLDLLDSICEAFGCQPGDVLEHVSEQEALDRFGESFVMEHKRIQGGGGE